MPGQSGFLVMKPTRSSARSRHKNVISQIVLIKFIRVNFLKHSVYYVCHRLCTLLRQTLHLQEHGNYIVCRTVETVLTHASEERVSR